MFSSQKLELRINRLAENLAKKFYKDVDLETIPSRGTLHLMTKAFNSGGHTRVVERWIASSNVSRQHSILLTKPGKIPKTLSETQNLGAIYVSRNFLFRNVKWIAAELQNYDQVVAHIHPDDVDAVLAMWICKRNGSTKIALFNHADHQFWVGAEVASVVLEFRSFGAAITKWERGNSASVVVGLPPRVKTPAKVELKIPQPTSSRKLLVAVGRGRKFVDLPRNFSFATFATEFLTSHEEFDLVIVGPRRLSQIRKLASELPGRVTVLPTQPLNALFALYRTCSVGLDTFPMSGGTVSMDMSYAGLPVVSLNCPSGLRDIFPGENRTLAEDYFSWEAAILNSSRTDKLKLGKATTALENIGWGVGVDEFLRNPVEFAKPKRLTGVQIGNLADFLSATEPGLANFLARRVF